jgi:curli biogenesis system outer membrane secretion channel CsgG
MSVVIRHHVMAGLGLGLATLGALAADEPQVEKCSRKLGVIALVEPQQGWGHLGQYGLGSPAALLRGMVQQSGCFDVVERGVALQNLQQERALASGGDLRQESNLGKGQMQAADFVMTPNVQIGASTTGGVGGALLSRFSGTLGAIAGSLKFKEAQTSLLVADVRSSLQVAAAEGKATKTDFGIGGWLGLGGAGGFTSTPEGKMVAAGFLDNYNKIVLQIRDQPQLIRSHSASGDANAAGSTRAEAPQAAGQVLQPKIANVKVHAQASRESRVLATLQRGDELIASGEVKDGFVFIDSANVSGWVQRTLVGPAAAQNGAQAGPAAGLPLAGGAVLAPALVGTYAGSFSGSENGHFLVTVTANGQVIGSGSSQATGAFSVNGRADANGGLSLAATGRAGSALYAGRIDPARGQLSGQWQYQGLPGGGDFVGQRQ